jgi:hypothetical protein
MKKNYTHVAILIDRSGSMGTIKDDVIGGFNQLISDQKKEPGELTVSLVQFDDNVGIQYETINDFSSLENVQLLNESNYVPRGGTPLNDSLAKLINETGAKLASMSEDSKPEKVLVVCITDGHENASKEYVGPSGKKALKEIIERQEKTYNWKFMYIGANQDSFAEGTERGMGASLNYSASKKGVNKMSKVFSASLSSYRSASPDKDFNLQETVQKLNDEIEE